MVESSALASQPSQRVGKMKLCSGQEKYDSSVSPWETQVIGMITEQPAALIRPQFVALDSSHLGAIAADNASGDQDRVRSVEAFTRAFDATGSVLLLCLHHLQELFAHKDDNVVAQRIAYLQSLPLVASVAPFRKDGLIGSVADLQSFEVASAFSDPAADVMSVRDRAAASMFLLSSGGDVIRPLLQHLSLVRTAFMEQEARSRDIVAISRSDFASNSSAKIVDLLKSKLRAPDDISRQFQRLQGHLSAEIRERGDKRIPDAERSSQAFLDEAKRFGMAVITPDNPALLLLEAFEVQLSEVGPETTLADVGRLAVFRRKLKSLNENLDLPWPELKARVTEDRLPSGVIVNAIKQFHPDMRERDGSELTDRYLACLSAYADVTYVDKRTHEASLQARQKQPIFGRLVHRLEKAGSYEQIAQQLQSSHFQRT
jgi:hypothetical protein